MLNASMVSASKRSISLRGLAVTVMISLIIQGCSLETPLSPSDYLIVEDFVFVGESTVVLATPAGEVHRSDDAGASWRRVHTFPQRLFSRSPYIFKLAAGENGSVWGLLALDSSAGAQLASYIPSVVVSTTVGTDFVRVPSQELIDIPVAFAEDSGANPLILEIDGRLWQSPSQMGSIASIARIGIANPDHDGTAIELAGSAIYVAAIDYVAARTFDGRLWRSGDQGATWIVDLEISEDEIADVSCSGEDLCWLVTRNGQIFRRELENAVWVRVVDLEPTSGLISLVTDGTEAFVAGQDGPLPSPFVVLVSANGELERFDTIAGGIARSIRLDAEGVPWVAGEGLFRWHQERRVWVRVWPMDSD